MNNIRQSGQQRPHLVWVSTITPSLSLDSATWLDTTQELRRLGWEVTLVGKGEPGRHTVRDVEVFCLSHPSIYFLGQWIFHFHILRFLARHWREWDAILFHQISAFWLLPLRFLRSLTGSKRPLFIMDTRDLPDFDQGTLRLRLRKRFYDLVYWMANRWADGQTAITSRMAELVAIPPAQLWGIWPSGVNPDAFTSAYTARQWPRPDEPIQLIYIGRLIKERNLLPLCHAVKQANTTEMDFVFTLVGDGGHRDELAKFAVSTAGAVRVLPSVPHEQMPQLLAQAHIGVTSLPSPQQSKYQASSPIKLFEYMAAGMPILSTRNVCHTDVVEEGAYAFWVNDANETELLSTLKQIWQNRAQLSALGEEAVSAAQDWTWQATAGKLSKALESGMIRHKVDL